MDFLTSTVLSGILWDVLKKGISVSKEYLKKRLSKWLLEDEELEIIKEVANNIPDVCLRSEGLLREYLNADNNIQRILNSSMLADTSVNQTILNNNGISVGIMENGNISINNYASKEKPRDTFDRELLLTEGYTRYKPVQVVKSFSSTRDNCDIIDDNGTPVIYTEIVIPKEVKMKEGCQFVMLLFPFSPPENFENYSKEGYFLEFILDISENIHFVQLQVKNSRQNQFIDLPIKCGHFRCKLSELASENSWQDICEICFTIFADDKYITNDKGYIKIKGLRLSKSNY